jgi:hypothetical protein
VAAVAVAVQVGVLTGIGRRRRRGARMMTMMMRRRRSGVGERVLNGNVAAGAGADLRAGGGARQHEVKEAS